MLRIVFVILLIQNPIIKLSAQIIGPSLVEYNSNNIYTDSHVGQPGVSVYFWKVIGGTQLVGATQTLVEVKWNKSEYGRIEKWLKTYQNNNDIMMYELSVTVQNTPAIEYTYDNAGNRESRRIIYLNSTQLKKSTQSNDLIEEKEVIEDKLGNLEISIYPNPTAGIISIITSGLDENSSSSIAIYSMSGKQIQQISPIDNTNTIDLSTQPDGAYIFIITRNSEISKWKIIKQ
jgi:hypothetical protein